MGMILDPLQYRTTDLALPFAVHDADMMKSRDKGGIQVLVQLYQGLLDPHLSEVDFQGRRVQSPNQKGRPRRTPGTHFVSGPSLWVRHGMLCR